ncbi:MAG: hypothetical protein GY788_21160 [bacterium]|nr:hypothetical protein [bacterium]
MPLYSREAPQPTLLNIELGRVPGMRVWTAFGERESMGTTAAGEDLWRGTATTVPTPAAAGEQLVIVSGENEDASGGDGVRTVVVHYLDATGAEAEEEVTLLGKTPVVLVESNIRFVQSMHATTVGDTGVAEGAITLYQQGDATRIYSMIAAGGNMSMLTNRMIPIGHRGYIVGWHASEAQGKRCAFRLRSTSHGGTLHTGAFIFKDVVYIKQGETGFLQVAVEEPPLSVVKITGWPDQEGAEAGGSYTIVIVKDGTL